MLSGYLCQRQLYAYYEHTHNEATLDQAQQSAASVERALAIQQSLHSRHQTPSDHLDRNPAVRAKFLRDQLRGQLSAEEGNIEDGCRRSVCV
jgi:hypothetical protein